MLQWFTDLKHPLLGDFTKQIIKYDKQTHYQYYLAFLNFLQNSWHWRLWSYLYPLIYTPTLTMGPKKTNNYSTDSIRNFSEKDTGPLSYQCMKFYIQYQMQFCSSQVKKSYSTIRKGKRKATQSKRYWTSWFGKSWARSHQTLSLKLQTCLTLLHLHLLLCSVRGSTTRLGGTLIWPNTVS